MQELAAELDLLSAGTVTGLDPGRAVAVCEEALATRDAMRARLDLSQQTLRARAAENLSFLRELPPYAGAFAKW